MEIFSYIVQIDNLRNAMEITVDHWFFFYIYSQLQYSKTLQQRVACLLEVLNFIEK